MDYEPYDSSGTDDDLPPTHQNRIPRGGRVAANGRSAVGYPRMYGETDMEAQIHQLEQEAYCSVLRAFKAQSDAITWEKESLITELRKELRLSNEEHRELLGRVDADDVIRRIREWRQGGGLQPEMGSSSQAIHDPMPSPSVSASRKKQKITPSQSFGLPSTPFQQQAMTAAHQLSTSAAKRGSVPGAKGNKKHKPGQMVPGASSMKPLPSSGASGRAQVANRVSSRAIMNEPAAGTAFDKLIGRRVRTRWPDDNNFYEAVITDYNAIEGLHALVYDIGTPNQTWEWVNVSEISPEDIQWEGDDPGVSQRGAYGRPGHGNNRPAGRDSIPGAGRGRGVSKPSRKDYLPSQNGTGKNAPDDIQILQTDTLIKEVERVFGASHPDPREIEKAKKVLKDHEQALIDAIARLADISDGESGEEGHHFSHGQSMEQD